MFKIKQIKIKKIKKEINIVFSIVLIILLLFSGIIFPNVYLVPNPSPILNIPLIISFIVVFSLFVIFNIGFITNKEQLIKDEVKEVEEESTSE